MQKKYAYVLGSMMILTTALITVSCEGSSEDDEDLVGNWKKSSDFDEDARSEAVTFVIGDSVYFATGTTDRDKYKDLWVYSLNTQYWSQRADLPGAARNSAVAFSIGTKGYVGTGYDGSNKLNDFYEFNPANNSWIRKADFAGSARYDAVGFSINGKGYISCGFDGNYLKDVYEYTPGATAADPGTWVQKASLGGTKRTGAMVFVLDNKAYICSGSNNGSPVNELWMFDGATWTEKRKISNVSDDDYDDDYNIMRSNAVAFTIGNYAYIATGENASSLTSTTWQYDPSTDLWKEKTGFEGSARTGAVAFSVGNRGFVMTGRSGSLSFDNMYEFQPDIEQNDDDN